MTNPLAKELLSHHQVRSQSLIVLNLGTQSEPVGTMVLSSSFEMFSEEDMVLVAYLHDPLKIAMSNALKHLEVKQLKEIIDDDNAFLHTELRRLSGEDIIGRNFGLKSTMDSVQQVASLDSPVTLQGETGVGKDVIASAIHNLSLRRNAPMITVNCGAIPENLIDSELFGHEKGAFTGALSQKRGRFERAQGGTLFLDEIGEIPPSAQVRLLRVLQNKEIERVGGSETIKLDVRFIAATNRNLQEMVETGKFREDLWFRINLFPIWIPPLRDRKLDIPALVHHFLSLKTIELKLPEAPSLSMDAMDRLIQYRWPGNIRELQNVVERELIVDPKGPLAFSLLAADIGYPRPVADEQNADLTLDSVNRHHIEKVLNLTAGKISGPGGAAELLGINANTLRNRMSKLGIK